jgi:molybdate transport system substrate-binding protein
MPRLVAVVVLALLLVGAGCSSGGTRAPATLLNDPLEILVPAGNPKGIRDLADLGRGDLLVVLGDPAVPFGKDAAQVLDRAGVIVEPLSLEPDAPSAVAKVVSGEADATIVHTSDAATAGAKVEGVAIPDA